ncbi:FMN-dependent NADH-azoreductase [Candidatus Gracilibacteria bacterium]|nr:FMN-dependent NADH-azoreductase [Candidatus Gracilibacteria bacterium]NJM86509.1 FMN-dependent NADH-azoreductase [Hydrococcus sp. RU_2_2]NJP20076.1 FMN-dependent NADH-azoreductase [Hydrococcus sp. CRU_1_1]NJQ98429.1 FMN-dependent NADH-azoreductase [Hydrococcus sp. CSU_1_8]
MTHILHLDTSPRAEQSHSRMLAQEFIEKWRDRHPQTKIIYRDLGLNPIPYIDATWIKAKFTPPDQYTPELVAAIKLSDELIDEFLAADRYVLSTPMYNFSIPAVLKSYIDYIVRPRRTFAVDANGFKGLVTDKKMLVITARGSDFSPGSALAPLDFQEPFLRTVFNFIGITDIQFINANKLNSNLREQSLAEAKTAIQDLAPCW